MSDYETAQRRSNIVVGIFVLIGLCALVWLIFKFGDLPIKVSEYRSFEVIVQFPTAKGIQKNASVEFCGYQVGRVTHVMSPEVMTDLNTGLEYHQTKVILSIDKEYVDIPSNVDVKLMTRSLGSSYIELVLDPTRPLEARDPNRPETKFLVGGMPLQGSTGMTSEFFPAESQQKLVELIDGVNTFIANAIDIIGDQENKDNFKQILANLSQGSEEFPETLEYIREFAETGTSTFEHADSKMDEVFAAVVDMSDDIRQLATSGTTTMENFDAKAERLVTAMVDASVQLSGAMRELQVILGKVNNGQGTAARILNDGGFYENLLENTEQLQLLLDEMKTFVEEWEDKKIELKLIDLF